VKFRDSVLKEKNENLQNLSDKLDNQNEYLAQLEKTTIESRKLNEDLKESLISIENENQYLKEEIKDQQKRFSEFKTKVDDKNKDMAEALAEIFETQSEIFQGYISDLSEDNKNRLKDQLSKLSNKDQVVKELLKFKEFSKHFHTIEVRISENNVLYINDISTNERPSDVYQVYSLIKNSIENIKDQNHGLGRIMVLWSYGKDATMNSRKYVDQAVNKLHNHYSENNMILARCGFVPGE
jgi:hypothetical protein